MSGGTISITGAEDVQPTFNFSEAAIGDMAGEILFNGGHLLITGDYISLFDAAIGAGNIYTTVPAKTVHAKYFTAEGLTKLVLVSSEKAYHPNPADGQKDVTRDTIFKWMAGDYADTHDVYFGMVFDDVNDADIGNDPNGVLVSQNQTETNYEPPGLLEFGRTYYWRIDEVNDANPESPWVGSVWSFTTANFRVVDDFESYNDLDPEDPNSNRIFNAWLDGYDNPTNGSIVGYAIPSFAEQTIVHSGKQSMPMYYDNSTSGKSEATLTLTDVRDWTENGVDTLVIWYIGDPANDAEQMYVTLNGTAAVTHDNSDAALTNTWTEWRIDLQAFADQGVNLSNINTITIGFGNRTNPVTGGSGMVFFDDIRLYRPAP